LTLANEKQILKNALPLSGLKVFKMEMVNASIFLLKLAFQYSKRVRQRSNAYLLGYKGKELWQKF